MVRLIVVFVVLQDMIKANECCCSGGVLVGGVLMFARSMFATEKFDRIMTVRISFY